MDILLKNVTEIGVVRKLSGQNIDWERSTRPLADCTRSWPLHHVADRTSVCKPSYTVAWFNFDKSKIKKSNIILYAGKKDTNWKLHKTLKLVAVLKITKTKQKFATISLNKLFQQSIRYDLWYKIVQYYNKHTKSGP